MNNGFSENPTSYLNELQRIEREQELAKLHSFRLEFAGVLDFFPKLREELDAFHQAEGVALDGLADRLRPMFKQAASFQLAIMDLPYETRHTYEVEEFIQSVIAGITLQTIAPLAAKLPDLCSAAHQRLTREKAEASRRFIRNLKVAGVFGVAVVLAVGGYLYLSGEKKLSAPSPVVASPTMQQAIPVATPAFAPPPHQVTVLLPTMRLIPAGEFTMGCLGGRDDIEGMECNSDETPQHKVSISAFQMAETETTVAQFQAFVGATGYQTTAEKMGSCWSDVGGGLSDVRGNSWRNLGFTQMKNEPVGCVSWDDAQRYVAWLTEVTGKMYRLPSEAEWEYAARGGQNGAYPWGQFADHKYANYAKAVGKTTPVGQYPANGFSLRDMHGNVWEWCQDAWHGNYQGAPSTGIVWAGGDMGRRVVRGGAWDVDPDGLRSAFRGSQPLADRGGYLGFRVVCCASD